MEMHRIGPCPPVRHQNFHQKILSAVDLHQTGMSMILTRHTKVMIAFVLSRMKKLMVLSKRYYKNESQSM